MLNIISEKEYRPSTTVIKNKCKQELDTGALSRLLPVIHVLDDMGERVKLMKKREKVLYYGRENAIISCTGDKFQRGLRSGVMQNMISVDFQSGKKNIHFKISSKKINCMGSKELNDKAAGKLVDIINDVQTDLNYIYTLDEDYLLKARDEILNVCSGNLPFYNFAPEIFDIDDSVVKKIFMSYISDFDTYHELEDKLNYIIKAKPKMFEGDKLEIEKCAISNAVYQLNILKDEGQELPLDQIAQKLYLRGARVQYHNWHQCLLNVRFRIEDDDSNYFHRFEINLKGTLRQFSPTLKEESYRYYQGLALMIQNIITENEYSLDPP